MKYIYLLIGFTVLILIHAYILHSDIKEVAIASFAYALGWVIADTYFFVNK